MNQTFQSSAQVLSIGVFFTLMIIGLAASLPDAMSTGLEAHGVPAVAALPASDQAALTGSSFFPQLISGPFQAGLHAAFSFAIVACLVAAAASWMRGAREVVDAG